MKITESLSSAFVLCIAFVILILLYRWDEGTNHGFKFGYYGDINRVRSALFATPGISVTSEWAHKDITLEEFGFDIVTATGQTVDLDFSESDPTRNLSGQRLKDAMAEKIRAKATLPAAP